MKFNVSADVSASLRQLDGFSERRIRAATATALTRTAWEVANNWKRQFITKLDRPTAFTTRSVLVKGANAAHLEAVISLRDTATPGTTTPSEYLTTQERGGSRGLRKFERALVSKGSMPQGHKVVPAKHAKLDAYGNISRGQIVQVLNQLGGDLSVGYRRVVSSSAVKRKKSAKRAGRAYVAIPRQIGNLEPGVYERKDRLLLPVFFFINAARYSKKLRLIEDGQKVIARRITAQVERALAEHRARLAAR